jgi:hypothetical protein
MGLNDVMTWSFPVDPAEYDCAAGVPAVAISARYTPAATRIMMIARALIRKIFLFSGDGGILSPSYQERLFWQSGREYR